MKDRKSLVEDFGKRMAPPYDNDGNVHIKTVYGCECHSEGLVLEYDKEHKELMIAFWSNCAKYIPNVLGWKERLRWIWNMIKTGSPYTDMVVVSRETAITMAEDILKQVK